MELERKYETFCIFDPGASEDLIKVTTNKIEDVISKFGGKIIKHDSWGTVELAYPIRKHKNGKVFVIIYTGRPGVVEEIERHFKISDSIMRYITVIVTPDYNYEKVKKQMKKMEDEWNSRSYEQKMERRIENVEKAKS